MDPDETSPLTIDSSIDSNAQEDYRTFVKCDTTADANQDDLPSNITQSSGPIAIFVIAIFAVIGQVGMVISLPILAQMSKLNNCPSDQYFVIIYTGFWLPVLNWLAVVMIKLFNRQYNVTIYASQKVLMLIGLFNALNSFFVFYASPPSRTAPELQAVLTTSIIPFTVILRYFILGKGASVGRLICTVGTLIGLFISLEPNIFNISDSQENQVSSFWPFIFGLGYLPMAAANVLQEHEIKKDRRAESLVFEAWMQIYNFISQGLLFWTDFIPGYGEAKTFKQFQDHMDCGFKSQFSGDSVVHYPWAAAPAWLFIIFCSISNLAGVLLTRYADGAVYLSIVQALATPIAAFFWTLFTLENGFHWKPKFTTSTAFIVGGLLVMIPCIILYNYNVLLEEKAATKANNEVASKYIEEPEAQHKNSDTS